MQSQQAQSQALCQEIRDEIHGWNSKWEMVLRGGSGESTAQQTQSGEPAAPPLNRLLCQPNFDADDLPIDVQKQHSFPEESVVPYESLTEPLGSEQSTPIGVGDCVLCSDVCCKLYNLSIFNLLRLIAEAPTIIEPKIQMCIGPNCELYIANPTDDPVTIGPGELIGFGLGAFVEMLSSTARGATDVLCFSILKDNQLVVYQENPSEPKKAMAMASLICHMATAHGVMDVNLQDHNLEAMVKAWLPNIVSMCVQILFQLKFIKNVLLIG